MPILDQNLRGDAQYQHLAGRLRPVFERIAADALGREQHRTVSKSQFGWLKDAGFGRLRIPNEHGGLGSRLSDVLLLASELAEVDPNLAHVWRSQYAFIEDRINASDDPGAAVILRRLAGGEVVGGGWSERSTPLDALPATSLTPADGGGYTVTGEKYYSTGSIYADWITVLAKKPDEELVVALVNVHQPGVDVHNDWDGFGQQITGSGTVTYRDAHVANEQVIPYTARFRYQAQYYQAFLNAVVVGIGRAVLRDGIAALRNRGRSHPSNVAAVAREDPQLLQVIGDVASRIYAADAAFLESVRLIDLAIDEQARASGGDRVAAALEASWNAVAAAQLVITRNVLDAATLVLDALGSSGTSTATSLDRHWRNARTIASHNPRVTRARDLGNALVNGVAAPTPADERRGEPR